MLAYTQAVQHIKRVRGGAQGQLMYCSDGFRYIVKFQNNPQHRRILPNELLATRLGEMIGLSVASPAIVDVPADLIDKTPALQIEIGGTTTPFAPGLAFASRYVGPSVGTFVTDFLPEQKTCKVRNLREFAGILALDKWTGNVDGRQVAYWKTFRQRKFTASFIDQGYCFGGGEWKFQDAPLGGVFGRNDVYVNVTGWESFEPWLSRIEAFPVHAIRKLAADIPSQWRDPEDDTLNHLVSALIERRSRVRELILLFRSSSRKPFPNWREEIN